MTADSTGPPPGAVVSPNLPPICLSSSCVTACFLRDTSAFTCGDAGVSEPTPADDWETVVKSYYQVLDLGGAADQQAITLTLQGSLPGDNSTWPLAFPVSVQATLYGDTRFVMEQTSRSFRPVDSRDPSLQAGTTNCPAFDPTNDTNDNCHPTFCAWLTLAPEPGPGCRISLGPMFRANGRSPQLKPDPAAPVSQADTLSAAVTFTLSPTRDQSNQAKPWLTGTSTNWGTPKTKKNTPPESDYVFEQTGSPRAINPAMPPVGGGVAPMGAPDSSGLTIATTSVDPLMNGFAVTVTSRDFGGSAWLSAKATLLGATYDVQIVDPNTGQDVLPPANSVGGSCGTAFATHAFAFRWIRTAMESRTAGSSHMHRGSFIWTTFLIQAWTRTSAHWAMRPRPI